MESGDVYVPPFCVRAEDFTSEEAAEILQSPSSDKIISVPPCEPKAGEAYLFKPDSIRCKNDWKADQYRWYQNGRKQLTSIPVIQKVYAININSAGKNPQFKRSSYSLLDDTKNECLTLIHYTGDHTTANKFPHGNSKSKVKKAYVRTCPSVLQAAGQVQDVPSNVYKKMVAEADCANYHQPVLVPRDTTQVKNVQARNRQLFRLTHDALYNLHEIAYDLGNFVSKIITYPNLVVVCGLKSLKQELDRLILLSPDDPILLSYDTTFQLGDFYVSPFLFKHVLFESHPVIPVAFLLHERKFQIAHTEFMAHLKEEIPSLSTAKLPVPIVVDDEIALCNAIDASLPGVVRVRCWNHTINAVKLWLRRHGAVSAEIPIYVSNLRDLFHQPSDEAYRNKLEELKTKWSEAFLEYYYDSVHPEVTKSIGRWILERLGIYSPYCGITTNQSEGFNTVLKHLQHWKEAPIDAIVLSLYRLQSFYYNEIQRGFSALGSFSLDDRYSALTRPHDEILTSPVHSPDEIVKRIKEKTSISDASCDKDDVDSALHDGTGAIGPPADDMGDEDQTGQEFNDTTQRARARAIINSGNISHNEKLGVFTVLGTTGNPNVIRLFPKESCSCPSTGRCYHIMAVRMSIGLDIPCYEQKINLTQLRRNSRSRKDKTSGRKRPRVDDCEIVAAPDSLSSNQLISNPLTFSSLTSSSMMSNPSTSSSTCNSPTSSLTRSNPPTSSLTSNASTSSLTSNASTSSLTSNASTSSLTTSNPLTFSSMTSNPSTSSSTSNPPASSLTRSNPSTSSSTSNSPASSLTRSNPSTSSSTSNSPTSSSMTSNPPTSSSMTSNPPTSSSMTSNPPTSSSMISNPSTSSSTSNPPASSLTRSNPSTSSSTSNSPASSLTRSNPSTSSSKSNSPTSSSMTSNPPTSSSMTSNPPTSSLTKSNPPTSSLTSNALTSSLTTSNPPTSSSMTSNPPTSILTSNASTSSLTKSNPPTSSLTSNALTSSLTTSNPPTSSSMTSNPPTSILTSNASTSSLTTSNPSTSSLVTSNSPISITSTAKRRQRKKIRLNGPPTNNNEPGNNEPGNNEILPKFDKLYSAIRKGEKLDDNHISVASKLLHQQFPDFQGLSTPVLGQNLSFPPVNSMLLLAGYEYIQILHTGADHWVTVCVVSSYEVKIYDSLFHSTTYATKKQIASIMCTREHQVTLQIGMTQFQENSFDCGVYAIAFATELCHGNDPSQVRYDVPYRLRVHLLDSLKAQKITPFPSVKIKCKVGYLTEKMNIYCKCRLLYAAEHGFPSKAYPRSEDIHMIQCYACDEWYHKSCANLSIIDIKRLRKSNVKWLCEKCSEHFDLSSDDSF